MRPRLVALTVAGVCAAGLVQARETTPREALQAYLADELQGARLDSDRWRRFVDTHVLAAEAYDEPGWDQVVLVRSAQVLAMRCTNPHRCTAEVQFALARADDTPERPRGAASHPGGGDLRERYTLIWVGEGWRVAPPLPPPRVMPSALQR